MHPSEQTIQPRIFKEASVDDTRLPIPERPMEKFLYGHHPHSWTYDDARDEDGNEIPGREPSFQPVISTLVVKAGANRVPQLQPGQTYTRKHLEDMASVFRAKGGEVWFWGDPKLGEFRHYMAEYPQTDGKKTFASAFAECVRLPSGDIVWRQNEEMWRAFVEHIRDHVAQPMTKEVFEKLIEIETRVHRKWKAKGTDGGEHAKAIAARIARMRKCWAEMVEKWGQTAKVVPGVRSSEDDDQPTPTDTPQPKRGARK